MMCMEFCLTMFYRYARLRAKSDGNTREGTRCGYGKL